MPSLDRTKKSEMDDTEFEKWVTLLAKDWLEADKSTQDQVERILAKYPKLGDDSYCRAILVGMVLPFEQIPDFAKMMQRMHGPSADLYASIIRYLAFRCQTAPRRIA